MFLLDTNVLSELRKIGDGKADPNVVAWLSGVDASTVYLSAMTLFEIEFGILRVERRDSSQSLMLRSWMTERVLPEFDGRILALDTAIALRCATLHVPNPRSERDAWIAATALVHSLTVVTRNTSDFEGTGAALLNPWLAM